MLKNKLHSIKIIIFVFAISFLLTNFSQAALVGNTTQATLKLSPETGSFTAGTNFTVSIYLNTANQNVVAAAAYLNYDKVYFQAVSIDTTNSVFTAEAEKVINTTNGIIKITLGKPTPGVNTSNGLVAKINFQALSAVSPTADNLTFQFTAGATTESNVIKDDGLGTDILSGVYNGRYAIQSNICTSFTYSSWSVCQPNNTQSRTVVSSLPQGCAGGSPILTQSCVYTPPTCTDFTYSAWSSCQPNNTQSRTVVTQIPLGCSGGNPILSQSCVYTPPTCTSFTYSTWSACQSDNSQSRTVISSFPQGCVGGSPILTQSCVYTPPTCTDFTYSAWSSCQPNNTQSRTVVTQTPLGCTGGSPVLTQSCVYTPPICTSFTYSSWSECQSNNIQIRTIISQSPINCTGGSPVLSQSCTYIPTSLICTSFTYSSWGICQPDNTQARTIATKSPSDCTGGNPVLSQSCVYTPPACTSFTYSAWSSCQPNNTQSRTVVTQTPLGCTSGNPILSQSCAYTPSTPEPTPTLTPTPTPTPTLTPTPTPTPEVDITQIQVEILSVQESLSELANLIKINPQNPEIPSRFSALTQKLLEISAKIQALKSEFIFMRNLYLGIRGEDVKKLQELLAKDKSVYPKGLITGYYGILTQKTVQKFQCKYNIICSGSLFTTGYGRLGPKTRTKLDELYGQ